MTIRRDLDPDIEAARPAGLQDLEATLDALAEMGRDLPYLPSSAFSRESIYQDHD